MIIAEIYHFVLSQYVSFSFTSLLKSRVIFIFQRKPPLFMMGKNKFYSKYATDEDLGDEEEEQDKKNNKAHGYAYPPNTDQYHENHYGCGTSGSCTFLLFALHNSFPNFKKIFCA